MDKLNEKHAQLLQALKTLDRTLKIFERVKQNNSCCITNEEDGDEAYRIHRDSVIQRFEYCTDLLWKYIKKYLESANILIGPNIPAEIVRRACAEKIISEDEAETILEIIKSRNKTSHIYIEEIAEQLSKLIPNYYNVMCEVANKLQKFN